MADHQSYVCMYLIMKVFNNILRLSYKDNNICLSLTLANESSAIEVQVQGFPFH